MLHHVQKRVVVQVNNVWTIFADELYLLATCRPVEERLSMKHVSEKLVVQVDSFFLWGATDEVFKALFWVYFWEVVATDGPENDWVIRVKIDCVLFEMFINCFTKYVKIVSVCEKGVMNPSNISWGLITLDY